MVASSFCHDRKSAFSLLIKPFYRTANEFLFTFATVIYPLDWSYLYSSALPWAKSKAFTVVKQPMQSKELHKKTIHFLFTNDSPARLPFQCMQCVTNMYMHYDRT